MIVTAVQRLGFYPFRGVLAQYSGQQPQSPVRCTLPGPAPSSHGRVSCPASARTLCRLASPSQYISVQKNQFIIFWSPRLADSPVRQHAYLTINHQISFYRISLLGLQLNQTSDIWKTQARQKQLLMREEKRRNQSEISTRGLNSGHRRRVKSEQDRDVSSSGVGPAYLSTGPGKSWPREAAATAGTRCPPCRARCRPGG